MEPHISDKQKAQAYDSYIKQILKYTARDLFDRKKRRGEREISLSGLTGAELTEIAVMDKYFADAYAFDVLDWRIGITDVDLAEALNGLPQDRRDIILLSFFLDMTDEEIAARLEMARSTVAYKRTSALEKLRERLEENADD